MISKSLLAILVFVFPLFALCDEAALPTYFVVHFETGPNWDVSLSPADQAGFREHSANLNTLRKKGTIVFGARYGKFGMIIIQVETLDEAKALVEADPGVRSGIFIYSIEWLNVFYPWQHAAGET